MISQSPSMRVDIWSDIVCPWCQIGKRRLEAALTRFEHAAEVEVVWHSFQLDPMAARVADGDPIERLSRKYGMPIERARAVQADLTRVAAAEGLEYHLERARSGNTFDAHRLLHLAADRGCQDAVKERLLTAYLSEGAAIGDVATLTRLAVEAGLDAAEVSAVLAGDGYAAAVREDIATARELEITGVPFFVIAGRIGVPGAQSPDFLLRALRQGWEVARTLEPVPAADPMAACTDESCAV